MNENTEYIENSFTKTDDKINLEIDNLNVSCITSKNNSFDLDSEGNLTVNSITATEGLLSHQYIIDMIYPIGSIYMSINSTNPAIVFGGIWEEWGEGRTIVGVDSSQTEFNTVEKTGGAKTHTLITSQLPAHGHSISSSGAHNHTGKTLEVRSQISGQSSNDVARFWSSSHNFTGTLFSGSDGKHTHTAANTGSGASHNNLQPYITCYMWKRTT